MARISNVSQISKKGVARLNEDAVLVDERAGVFGVFDGATSLIPYLSKDGKTGAYIASNLAVEAFTNTKSGSLNDSALVANESIEKTLHEIGIDTTSVVNRFCTTAVVARINGGEVELLCVGDSVIIVVNKNGEVALPLGYVDQDLEFMKKWQKLIEQGADDMRSIMMKDVIENRKRANEGYGFINGDKRLKNFIRTTTIDTADVESILLLTDGMFIPKADLDTEDDWERHVRLYQEGGLEKLLSEVRQIEGSDSDCRIYPRFKAHDDASGVAIDF